MPNVFLDEDACLEAFSDYAIERLREAVQGYMIAVKQPAARVWLKGEAREFEPTPYGVFMNYTPRPEWGAPPEHQRGWVRASVEFWSPVEFTPEGNRIEDYGGIPVKDYVVSTSGVGVLLNTWDCLLIDESEMQFVFAGSSVHSRPEVDPSFILEHGQ